MLRLLQVSEMIRDPTSQGPCAHTMNMPRIWDMGCEGS